MIFTYICMELKRLFRASLYMLIGAAVLAVIVSTTAFSISKIIYSRKLSDTIKVAVTVPEDDLLSEKLMSMISSMDSVRELCEFTYLKKNEAEKALSSGTHFAHIHIPDNFVEGIMSGVNTPATITFADTSGLEPLIFHTLTEAGASILGSAQACIYASDEYLITTNQGMYIKQSEDDLNRIFMEYSLNRASCFKKEVFTVTGQISLSDYYKTSGFLLFLFMTGISAAAYFKKDTKSFVFCIERRGIKTEQRILVKWGCFSIFLCILQLILILLAVVYDVDLILQNQPLILLFNSAFISAWTLLFFTICKNESISIACLFVVNAITAISSGYLIPVSFLPAWMQKFGQYTIQSVLMDINSAGEIATTQNGIMAVSIMVTGLLCVSVFNEKRRIRS
ncbi:MAG: ABC transporter permease [Lachnospiraceae bacterium]|nr:ABC transporter permease [Lachnospiraceae bacterium]